MFDFSLVGIDFVFHRGKMVFNEIEDVVGARMLYSKTDINIVSLYLDFILSLIHIFYKHYPYSYSPVKQNTLHLILFQF